MGARTWIVCGANLAALAIGLGAYGAHGLQGKLERLVPPPHDVALRQTSAAGYRDLTKNSSIDVRPSTAAGREEEINKRRRWFETAVEYQMAHAIALVLLGVIAIRHRSAWLVLSGMLFGLGIVLFSGLLFAMTFGAPRFLGAIVPGGGLAMILGWFALAMGAWNMHVNTREE